MTRTVPPKVVKPWMVAALSFVTLGLYFLLARTALFAGPIGLVRSGVIAAAQARLNATWTATQVHWVEPSADLARYHPAE